MKTMFVMDPIHTVNPTKDTTYALMQAAERAGQDICAVHDGGLALQDGQVYFHAVSVKTTSDAMPPFEVGSAVVLSQEEVDLVFVRTDPPFDERYLMHTWILDRLPTSIPVLNRPSGIRTVNEKLWATQFTDLVPRTIVTSHLDHLREFVAEVGDVIVKPTGSFGGHSVFHLTEGDRNVPVTLETLTERGHVAIIAQQYVAAATSGDKRILLLGGEPLGAVLRVHHAGDHRNNIFAGGRAEPSVLTTRDCEIVTRLAPHLQELGLHFVGIDVIGEYLIEVNVTSPTCLQELSGFADAPLADRVMAYAQGLMGQPG